MATINISCKILSDAEERKYKSKDGSIQSYFCMYMFTEDNRMCLLKMYSEHLEKLKKGKWYKLYRILAVSQKELKMQSTSKVL